MDGSYKVFLNGEQLKNVVAAHAGEKGFVVIEEKTEFDIQLIELKGRVQIYYHCDCGSIRECTAAVNLK